MQERESTTAFFHKLGKNDYNITDFNGLYANHSQAEKNLNYHPEEIQNSFSPLITALDNHIKSIPSSKLLEIGGSSGLLSMYLQEQGSDVTLLETEPEFVEAAKKRGVLNANIYDGFNLHKALRHDKKFDAIITNRVFEQIVMPEYQAKYILEQAKRFMKPNGLLFIGTQQPTAVWKSSINLSGFKLIQSYESTWHSYIQQVDIYSN